MNSCRYFRPRLALWAGGDLSASDVAAMQAHLAICPACGEHLRGLQQAISTLEHVDPEPTYLEQPRSLWPEVSRRISLAAAAPKVPVYRRRWVWGTAASCLLMLVTWLTWPREPAGPVRIDPRGAAHPGMLQSPLEESPEEPSPQSHSRAWQAEEEGWNRTP